MSCHGFPHKMENYGFNFAVQNLNNRGFRYGMDELPRLYSQDPSLVGDFDGSVKDELDSFNQYNTSNLYVGGQTSDPGSSSQYIHATTNYYPDSYVHRQEDTAVKAEEEDYTDVLLPSGLAPHPTDVQQNEDGSDRFSSGSPEPDDGSHEGSLTPTDSPYSAIRLPSHAETEQYLRDTIGIPYPIPVNLYALPESPDFNSLTRPGKNTELARLAIWGSAEKKLTLRQIYQAIELRYPALKALSDKPYQRSIRHNLSLKGIFRQERRPQNVPGQGNYWFLDVRYKEEDKRPKKGKKSQPSAPEMLPPNFVTLPWPSMGPSHLSSSSASANQLQVPHALRHNHSDSAMLGRTLNKLQSQAMLESLRSSNTDPGMPHLRPSYGSSIPYAIEYRQEPAESLPPHYTQDGYYQSADNSYPMTLNLNLSDRGQGSSYHTAWDPRDIVHPEGENVAIRQGERDSTQAEYVANIAGVSRQYEGHGAQHGMQPNRPQCTRSEGSRERDAEERVAARGAPYTRRTR